MEVGCCFNVVQLELTLLACFELLTVTIRVINADATFGGSAQIIQKRFFVSKHEENNRVKVYVEKLLFKTS